MCSLVVSAYAMSCIWLLDKLADMAGSGGNAKTIKVLINALSILIGFGWEKAFDVGVEHISMAVEPNLPASFSNVCWFKLFLSIILCLIVMPAWRLYILGTIKEMEEDLAAEKKYIKRHEGADDLNTPLIEIKPVNKKTLEMMTNRELRTTLRLMEHEVLDTQLEGILNHTCHQRHSQIADELMKNNAEMEETIEEIITKVDEVQKLLQNQHYAGNDGSP